MAKWLAVQRLVCLRTSRQGSQQREGVLPVPGGSSGKVLSAPPPRLPCPGQIATFLHLPSLSPAAQTLPQRAAGGGREEAHGHSPYFLHLSWLGAAFINSQQTCVDTGAPSRLCANNCPRFENKLSPRAAPA